MCAPKLAVSAWPSLVVVHLGPPKKEPPEGGKGYFGIVDYGLVLPSLLGACAPCRSPITCKPCDAVPTLTGKGVITSTRAWRKRGVAGPAGHPWKDKFKAGLVRSAEIESVD
jgi:hypothetical protein